MKAMKKKRLRKEIELLKSNYNKDALNELSTEIVHLLKSQDQFINSKVILLYHSLPDEVDTHELIDNLAQTKEVILPVVVGDLLELRKYTGKESLIKSSYDILEPTGPLFTDYKRIDLAVIPGVAFDYKGNRLGRGKGYYDKLLPNITAYKMGICFSFQYLANELIPTTEFDIPVDQVITTK